jgi:hypothetical protein
MMGKNRALGTRVLHLLYPLTPLSPVCHVVRLILVTMRCMLTFTVTGVIFVLLPLEWTRGTLWVLLSLCDVCIFHCPWCACRAIGGGLGAVVQGVSLVMSPCWHRCWVFIFIYDIAERVRRFSVTINAINGEKLFLLFVHVGPPVTLVYAQITITVMVLRLCTLGVVLRRLHIGRVPLVYAQFTIPGMVIMPMYTRSGVGAPFGHWCLVLFCLLC